MARWFPFRGKRSFLVLLLVATLVAVGWWQRTHLLAWYYVGGLAGAADGERETWITRVMRLDAGAVPALLACLDRDNARACGNAEAALVHLVRQWGPGDPRTLHCAEQVADRFCSLSVCGQQSALELLHALLAAQPRAGGVPAPAAQAAGHVLAAAAHTANPEVLSRALVLAELLVDGLPAGQPRGDVRDLVLAGLKSPDLDNKIRAAHLTLILRSDTDLLVHVVPLLRDPAAPVRRAALLAVGMAEKTIKEDELLALLHDPDADVRRLCESALRGRGLQDSHIQLARLISDARPAARLDVLPLLRRTPDLEPGVWLQRLSRDPSPAVRAGAVRAAATLTQVDLRDRLREIAQDDPSPTVRQLAGHYWQQHAKGIARPQP
jgi:HEAT repeat protein